MCVPAGSTTPPAVREAQAASVSVVAGVGVTVLGVVWGSSP